MSLPEPPAAQLPEQTRLAICLLHSIPGAVGRLSTHAGEHHVVAHCSDASLTPCELRNGSLELVVPGVPHLASVIASIEVVDGVLDIGGGLYQRAHPPAPAERWFATTLHPDRIGAIAAACPDHLDHGDVHVRICADLDLAASAVCVSAPPSVGLRLDEVACWLHSRCLVEELIDHTAERAGDTRTGWWPAHPSSSSIQPLPRNRP